MSIDGKSSDFISYTEDTEQNLKGYERIWMVAFDSIKFELPHIDPTIFSSDQKYLLEIFATISYDIYCSDVANRQRWIWPAS